MFIPAQSAEFLQEELRESLCAAAGGLRHRKDNMTCEEYITLVTDQVRVKKVHPFIQKELMDHITDQASRYIEEGESEEEGYRRAIREMGDPVAAGEELNKIHKIHFPGAGLGAMALLLIATVPLMGQLVSLTSAISAKNAVLWQSRNAAAGILLCLAVSLVDYKIIQKMAAAGLVLMDILLIAAVFQNLNGYVRLGPVAFQTVSLVPLYLPLFGGVAYALRREKALRLWPLLACAGLTAVLLFVLQGAPLASTQVVGTIMMLLSAGEMLDVDHRKYDRIVGMALVLAVILSAMIIAWQGNAAKVPTEFTYQESVSRSWQWSRWIGKSSTAVAAVKLGTTNVMSDGTFLGIAAVYGKLAAAGIVAILVILAGAVIVLSIRQRNLLGKMLGIGCGYSILLQTGLSVISCFCVGNPLGMGLPVFSYGGTGMAVYAAIIGTVLSLSAYRDITPLELCMDTTVIRT